MKNYIITLIILSTFSFAQEASTGNILEDHDKAVEGILSDEIKKQTEIVNTVSYTHLTLPTKRIV